MLFSALTWWMWAKGERDESVIALSGAVAFVEAAAEWGLVMALLGQ